MRTTLITMIAGNPALADARMTRIENQLRHRIMRTTHAVQSAILGRLAIDYIDTNKVREIFDTIKDKAQELGCDLLIQFHTDLFQVEASLLFDGKDAHILVHVPMAPQDGQMRLFRLHPFPLPLLEDKYLIPEVKNDVLAISSSSSKLNIQLAAVELLSCHRMNQFFMCDNFGVMSKRLNDTCLGALYFSKFAEAQKICKFKVAQAEELAYQIRKGEFIVYVPEPATIDIKCRNGTYSEKHLKRGSQTVSISKGCHGELKYHRLFSDHSDNLNAELTSYNWEWEPVNFMDNYGAYMTKAIEKLADLNIHTPDLSQIQYLASVPDSLSSSSNLGLLLTAICIGALMVASCVCAWCLYTKCPCCKTTSAEKRRGQGRKQRQRRSSTPCCTFLQCCRKRDNNDDFPATAAWARGSDTDDVTLNFPTPHPSRRSPRFATVNASADRQLKSDLLKANLKLNKRLSTLERQQKVTIRSDESEID